MSALKYLSAYSEQTQQQVSQLIAQNRLDEVLLKRYPKPHDIRTDKALYQYVQELRMIAVHERAVGSPTASAPRSAGWHPTIEFAPS